MVTIDEEQLRQGAWYAAQWVQYGAALRDVPGVVLGIGWKDGTVVLQASGKADIEHDVAMSVDKIFRIASHSKTFTAVAIMQLVERGKLRLDDPLGRHIRWRVRRRLLGSG